MPKTQCATGRPCNAAAAAVRSPLLLLLLAMLLPTGCTTAMTEPQPATVMETAVPAAAQSAGETGQPPSEEADYVQVRKEAEAGHAHAQLLLAEKLLAGVGTAKDVPQAHVWLEKAVAQDHAPAMDLLSALHYRGIGVPVDYHKARALMERAVEHRYLPAINNLAWFLSTCPDASVRDGARAVALLEPVIDQSPQMLDTLAAAYAEKGDFAHAGELQKNAVMALGSAQDPRFPSFIERLAGYGADRPWRDPAQ